MATKERERQRLVAELQRWDGDLKPYRELWEALWAAWAPSPPNAVPDKTKNPFISNVRDPFGFHAVETILPRVLGEEPKMAYKAVDDRDDEPVAAIMSGVTSWQMERMAFEDEARSFIRQGLVCGYTPGKVGWIRVEREVDDEEEYEEFDEKSPVMGRFKLTRPVKRKIVVRNAPFFETVSTFDFVWPLGAKTIQQAPAVWQRRFVTRQFLEDHKDVYSNLEKVTYNDGGRQRDINRARFEQQGLSPSEPFDTDNKNDAIAEIWERWGDADGEPWLYVIANPFTGDGVIIRDEESPFDHGQKPYIDWAPIGWPFQLHGVGIIQILFDQNEHLNTLLRQLSDARTYQLNPAWKSTGVTGNQLSLFPGMLLNVDDVEDIVPLAQPQIDFAAGWKEADELKRWMQRNTGAFEYLAGGGTESPQQTATGVATITNEGNKRIAEMIKVFTERTMKRFGWLLSMLNAQYLDVETAVDFSRDPDALAAWTAFQKMERDAGDEGPGLVMVQPEMFEAKGRLEPLPDVGQDKQVNEIQRRSDAVQLLQAMQPFLAVPVPVVNIKALAAYELKAFGVPKVDRDAILGAPDQPTEMELAAQQAALEQQANGNGSGPSGDNKPTGDVVGAPGVAGPSGPAGIG